MNYPEFIRLSFLGKTIVKMLKSKIKEEEVEERELTAKAPIRTAAFALLRWSKLV